MLCVSASGKCTEVVSTLLFGIGVGYLLDTELSPVMLLSSH